MARPIFLIGYMCSGKTTLGRALELATGLTYIDLDDLIEQEQGMTVREIFSSRGEATFRRLEREALARVAEMEDVIVGCGGGTPCDPANMSLMNSRGLTVHLRACRERLLSRLLEGREKRPLIARLDDSGVERVMDEGLAARERFYSQAMTEFDSSLLETPEEVEATVGRFVECIIHNSQCIILMHNF